jgi:Protein of unknown function (DUF1761)
MSNKTNWLAVAAAAVAGMFIGFLWYGAFFQNQWMAGNGITMDETANKMFKNGVEQTTSNLPMILNLGAMFFYAIAMDWLLRRANATTWQSGATIGGVIGLIGLVGVFIGNLFAMTPTSLSMVDGSYTLVSFLAMGAILGGWQKKGAIGA